MVSGGHIGRPYSDNRFAGGEFHGKKSRASGGARPPFFATAVRYSKSHVLGLMPFISSVAKMVKRSAARSPLQQDPLP